MSNRSLRTSHRHRFARRQRGGAAPFGGAPNSPAFGVGNMDTLTGSFGGASTTGAGSGGPVPISSWGPANAGCDAIPRTETSIHNQANPDIAGTNQFPILGGNMPVSPFSSTVPPISNAVSMPPADLNARQMGGRRQTRRFPHHRHRRGGPCPFCSGKRKQRGGGCGCGGMMRQSGGGGQMALQLSPTVLGPGPNPGTYGIASASQCLPSSGSEDPRGGNNQSGGRRGKTQRGGSASNISSAAPLDNAFPMTPQPSLGAANAFPESCYKAPGSELPVYDASSTAFNFSPSINSNNTLPPGVNVFNEVNQQSGRMGAPEPAAAALQGIPASSQVPAQRGGRRSRKNNRKNSRKNNRKNSRKNSRKNNRR